MANFNPAWNLTFKHEGLYQDDKDDSGNYNKFGDLVGTKYGITPNIYEAFYFEVPTKTVMENITPKQAMEIGKAFWWDYYQLAEIPLQYVANQVFDVLFHFSPNTAGNILQSSVLESGGTLLLYGKDNRFGSETLNAIIDLCNAGKGVLLNQMIVENRVDYYNKRVQKKPSQEKYLDGWLTRAYSYDQPISPIQPKVIYFGLFIAGAYGIYQYTKKKR